MENTPEEKAKLSFEDMERLKGEYADSYPEGLKLDPDSEQHKKLLEYVMSAAKASYEVISKRFPTWKELDEKLSVYVDLSDEEQDVVDDDESKPVSIVVPLSYATRETLLTYWVAAFLNHPLFRYSPSKDPNDLAKVIMLESIIAQHCIKSKVGLDLHTMWGDALTYGFGAASPVWTVERAFKSRSKSEVVNFMGIPIRKRTQESRESYIKFEGNALKALDPYNFLPDPNVPIDRVKDMDYCGWVERSSLSNLLKEEAVNDEYFNVKFLRGVTNTTSFYFSATDANTGRYSKTEISYGNEAQETDLAKPVDVIDMYAWVIPSDFGLSDRDYPEHWVFRVAADRVIISAKRSNFDHNTHPVATIAPDSDGHTSVPVAVLEREYPLQHAIDWLWKSHVANVRKAINNMFVVDPSRININDAVDSKFGMLVRSRAAAWGQDVKSAFMQLPVQDVTKGHIQDIGFLMALDSKVFTSDQAKGYQERSGERVSAAEAKDTRTAFLSKMEKAARIGAMQAHYDIAEQMGFNTVQMLEESQVVKILGQYKDIVLQEYGMDFDYAKVDPLQLDVAFDVVAQDGNIPGGENAPTWERLLSVASKSPEVFNSLDLPRVWLHIARLLGAKNPEEFRKRPLTSRVEDQTSIEKGEQQGNLVRPEELARAKGVGQ